jgi:hypothetical protein
MRNRRNGHRSKPATLVDDLPLVFIERDRLQALALGISDISFDTSDNARGTVLCAACAETAHTTRNVYALEFPFAEILPGVFAIADLCAVRSNLIITRDGALISDVESRLVQLEMLQRVQWAALLRDRSRYQMH